MFRHEQVGPSNISDGMRNPIVRLPYVGYPTTMASLFHAYDKEVAAFETQIKRVPSKPISSTAVKVREGSYGLDRVAAFVPQDEEVGDMVEAMVGFYRRYSGKASLEFTLSGYDESKEGFLVLCFGIVNRGPSLVFYTQRGGGIPKDQRRVAFQFSGGEVNAQDTAARVDLLNMYNRLPWEKRLKVVGTFVDFSSDVLQRATGR